MEKKNKIVFLHWIIWCATGFMPSLHGEIWQNGTFVGGKASGGSFIHWHCVSYYASVDKLVLSCLHFELLPCFVDHSVCNNFLNERWKMERGHLKAVWVKCKPWRCPTINSIWRAASNYLLEKMLGFSPLCIFKWSVLENVYCIITLKRSEV